MSDYRQQVEQEDDGRVVADMSDVERSPMMFPRFDRARRGRNRGGAGNTGSAPIDLTPDERRYAARGVIAAWLLVGGVFALAFAAIILLIGHLG